MGQLSDGCKTVTGSFVKGEFKMKQLKPTKREKQTTCDTCVNYTYDEDYGYYICEADLDEDEMSRFLSSSNFACPYYQLDDEYRIVRRQM